MSRAPSMPLFVDAFLADTMHLSCEEIGAYMLLLMSMWRNGGRVPDDDRDNARITRLSLRKWKAIKHRLAPALTFENDEISQKRLQKEWKYVVENSEKQRQKAQRKWGGQSNKNKDLVDAAASPRHMPERCPQSHTQSHSKKYIAQAFEKFWAIYPRKVGRDAARKALASALRRDDLEGIITGAERYAKARRDQDHKFTAYPASWLNAGRWSDEDPAANPGRETADVAYDLCGLRLKVVE